MINSFADIIEIRVILQYAGYMQMYSCDLCEA